MKSDITHEELLALAVAGSSEAFGRLMDRYRGYLKLLSRSSLKSGLNQTDASDMVQETFVLAFGGFQHFRGTTEAELSAWLRTILARCIADFHRRKSVRGREQSRRELIEAELDQTSTCWAARLVSPVEGPSGVVERRESLILLTQALDRLSADYREAIVLRQLEELSFADVASRMNRTVDSVRKLWTRGMIELRELMKGLQ